MAEYSYKGLSNKGNENGSINAADREEALRKVHDMGITVT